MARRVCMVLKWVIDAGRECHRCSGSNPTASNRVGFIFAFVILAVCEMGGCHVQETSGLEQKTRDIEIGLGIQLPDFPDCEVFGSLKEPSENRTGGSSSALVKPRVHLSGIPEWITFYASHVESLHNFGKDWESTGQDIMFLGNSCEVRVMHGIQRGAEKSKFYVGTDNNSEFFGMLVVLDQANVKTLPDSCIRIVGSVRRESVSRKQSNGSEQSNGVLSKNSDEPLGR